MYQHAGVQCGIFQCFIWCVIEHCDII